MSKRAGASNRSKIKMRLILKEEPKEWRKQTLLTALGIALISSIMLWRHHLPLQAAICIYAGLASIAICAFAAPRLFRGYYRFAMRLGFYLSLIVGRIVLTFFFFLVITPLGIILRLSGKDSLRLRNPPKADSYWHQGKDFSPLDKLF